MPLIPRGELSLQRIEQDFYYPKFITASFHNPPTMDATRPPHRLSLSSIMTLLHYFHALIVGVYFLGAYTLGICMLQKPLPISQNRRRGVIAFIAVTLFAYTIEVQ
jgi:heme A synthase